MTEQYSKVYQKVDLEITIIQLWSQLNMKV